MLRADTDLGAIRHNARVLTRLAAPAALLGVVKADAYGHGAVQVARVLVEEGVPHLAVASVGEATQLRAAGVDAPILVFEAPLADSLGAYVRLGLGVSVTSPEAAMSVVKAARVHGPLACHVKVDTGMHRLGLAPKAVEETLQRLNAAPGVRVEALWTHLATADGDLGFAREQLRVFDALLASLGPLAPEVMHVANGPALLRIREGVARPGSIVRAGGVLYGLASSRDLASDAVAAGLRPALRVATRVVHLQIVASGESVSYGRAWVAPEARRIATLAAGYADGVPRALSNAGHVGIAGALYPIVGRVCMDMLMVDLGPPEASGDVRVGDEAVLFGEGGPDILDQAEAAHTIAYDLTCGLATRVERTWRDAPPEASPKPPLT